MLVELRTRSQLTLPSEIVKSFGLHEGDKLEVVERDGGIFLCPVVVYPKNKLDELAKLVKESKDEPSKIYESVEEMFRDLGIDDV